MNLYKNTVFLITACLLTSCASIEVPIKEYSLARSAQQAARAAEAARYAPKLYNRAQKLYKRGKYYYKERYYDKARSNFVQARRYAEKAETTARIEQFRTGEMDAF